MIGLLTELKIISNVRQNTMIDFLRKLFGRDRLFGARRSSHWREVREGYLKANPYCAVCGGTKGLEVHHCLPVHLFPESELDSRNLITLCGKNGCHLRFGHLYSYKSFNSEIKEDSVVWSKKIDNRP